MSSPEKFYTIREMAQALGLPYWKVQRAAKAGCFPVHQFGNSRRLLLMSEVLAYAGCGCRSGDAE